jgi:hypothetical protein
LKFKIPKETREISKTIMNKFSVIKYKPKKVKKLKRNDCKFIPSPILQDTIKTKKHIVGNILAPFSKGITVLFKLKINSLISRFKSITIEK